MLIEYIYIGIMLCFNFFLGLVLLLLSFYGIPKTTYLEKTSPYESGFEPFSSSRTLFLVSFYLIGLLFLLFDLEIAALMPFVVIAGYMSFSPFLIAGFFLLVLTLGFIFELINYGIEFVGDMSN
jgi:NADH-quinone oxidoreductase subunit A